MAAAKRSKLQLLYDLAQRTFAEQKQPTSAQVDVLKLALSELGLGGVGGGTLPPQARHMRVSGTARGGSRRARVPACSAGRRRPAHAGASGGAPTRPAHPRRTPAGSVPLAELGIPHSEECACAEESCPGREPCDSNQAELQFNPEAHTGSRCSRLREGPRWAPEPL